MPIKAGALPLNLDKISESKSAEEKKMSSRHGSEGQHPMPGSVRKNSQSIIASTFAPAKGRQKSNSVTRAMMMNGLMEEFKAEEPGELQQMDSMKKTTILKGTEEMSM